MTPPAGFRILCPRDLQCARSLPAPPPSWSHKLGPGSSILGGSANPAWKVAQGGRRELASSPTVSLTSPSLLTAQKLSHRLELLTVRCPQHISETPAATQGCRTNKHCQAVEGVRQQPPLPLDREGARLWRFSFSPTTDGSLFSYLLQRHLSLSVLRRQEQLLGTDRLSMIKVWSP